MKTTKSEILTKSDKIIKTFFSSLEEIQSKANGRIVVVKNEDSMENLSISIGYLTEEPVYNLFFEQENEDVYNYIITNIFMKLRDKENATYSVNSSFNIYVEENNVVTSARFKGVHIFLFANNYNKKLKYIKMLKNDMQSVDFVNPWNIMEQEIVNRTRISKIQNTKLGK